MGVRLGVGGVEETEGRKKAKQEEKGCRWRNTDQAHCLDVSSQENHSLLIIMMTTIITIGGVHANG